MTASLPLTTQQALLKLSRLTIRGALFTSHGIGAGTLNLPRLAAAYYT